MLFSGNRSVSILHTMLPFHQNLQFGIKLEADGTLSIDDELLSQAISGPGSREALSPIKAFSDALIEKTKDISIDPMKYVDRPVVNYRNPDSRDTSSPYVTSEYSGMMFNNYC